MELCTTIALEVAQHSWPCLELATCCPLMRPPSRINTYQQITPFLLAQCIGIWSQIPAPFATNRSRTHFKHHFRFNGSSALGAFFFPECHELLHYIMDTYVYYIYYSYTMHIRKSYVWIPRVVFVYEKRREKKNRLAGWMENGEGFCYEIGR